MNTKRFAKGQTIFTVSSNFTTIRELGKDDVRVSAIITRTVDSCGVKRITFEDHGNDDTFGKMVKGDDPSLFATETEAREYVKKIKHFSNGKEWCMMTVAEVLSDRGKEWYSDLKAGKLTIVAA